MKLTCSFEIMELDDNVIAVPIGETDGFRGVVQLNESAAIIFEMLKEDITKEDIVNKLLSEGYEVSRNELEQYVDEFINGLLEKNLIQK